MKELPKVYDPKSVEKKIYDMWMEGGYFKGRIDPDKKPFSIVMPPPNVTGRLHMGHALDSTLQDILTRYKRMQGYSALWLPGVDHAGIATQIKVEEVLRKTEGKTRYDLGREKFLEREVSSMVKRLLSQSQETPMLFCCSTILSPYWSFQSQTRSRNFSRPRA